MATTITSLTPLPDYPVRGDAQATFTSKANAYVAAQNVTFNTDLPVFISQVNTVATETETARDAAQTAQTAAETAETGAELAETNAGTEADRSEAAADRAEGVINYRGLWSAATGSATAGGSYAHEGTLWLLLVAVGDITATEPDLGNSDWLRVSLPSTFDADAVTTMDLDFANGRYMVDDGERLETSGANEVLDIVRADVVNLEGPNGLIREVPAGVLAREWRAGEKRGALVQDEAENIALYSSDLTGAAWSGVNATAVDSGSESVITGKNWYTIEATGNGNVSREQTVTVTADTYTVFAYFEKTTASAFGWIFTDGATVWMDLSTGLVEGQAGSPTDIEIDDYGTGYQLAFSVVYGTSGSKDVEVGIRDATIGDTVNATGVQLTKTDSKVSYIDTAGTTVTRAADDISRTLGAEYNPSQGAFLIHAKDIQPGSDTDFGRVFDLNDGTDDNRIIAFRRQSGTYSFIMTTGGVNQYSVGSIDLGDEANILVTWNSDGTALASANGELIGSVSGKTMPVLTTLDFVTATALASKDVLRARMLTDSVTVDQANELTALEP